ncbi:Rubrerythrin [Halothermothrix orenii H 168]|uniref:Rubrerythrin n=1 Tax=Halothermothrix orenii (strain H 168 / OCM 544 / DSM 9562) TaxID=373903 RepID=B8CZD7_HALOH|nr:rubrerythrin family protein [Halothermothrix orenii]ACL70656.1 Rubrerythrin [Halothermothrix orenii H 168]
MVKNDMTAQNLRSAFGGESQAYQRYIVWGNKAEDEGFPGVALLFRAIAYAEQVHAGNHFKALENIKGGHLVASGGEFGLGKTTENLEGAIAGERFEVEQMYPAYKLVAKDQGEKEAIRSFNYALEAEKIHAKLYEEARESVEQGQDYQVESVSICSICGYTETDGMPDKCPICGAPRDKFKEFTK